MTQKYSISGLNDRLSYNIDRMLGPDKYIFFNIEEQEEFLKKIDELFSLEPSYQLYIEICAKEILDSFSCDKIITGITKITLKNLIDISALITFTRNDATVLSFMARKRPQENSYFEIRVASVGNVDAGKSTLFGVLTTNVLDDGRGLARSKMFRHQHEIDSGRTSSVGESILCVDSMGKLLQTNRHGSNKFDCEVVPPSAYKIFDFYDLAGHEKYLKTTIFGLVGLRPDYVMLVVGSNMGLVGMSREHLGLSLALEIPVFFVMTKIDICPEDTRKNTLQRLVKTIKSVHVNKKHIVIKSMDDVITTFVNLSSNLLLPIFQISCVTGEGLDFLKMFLSLLPHRQTYDKNGSCLFWIDDIYNVPGIGCVICGCLVRGTLSKTHNVLIGPNSEGEFAPLGIKSLHRKRTPVDTIFAGQTASIAIKKIKREDVRKGMVVVLANPPPIAYWEFKALIHILHHPTTICVGYQAVVHVGPIRQPSTITWSEKEVLRTGDRALVKMTFHQRPEYIVEDSNLVFREGRTKAIGIIKELVNKGKEYTPNLKEQGSNKHRHHPRKQKKT